MNPIHIVALVCSTWLSALAVGQEVDLTAARASHGVQATPDGAWAGGPDYSARFDGRGVEFTPVLGRAAQRPFPVRFTMASVRRGASDVFERTADVAPVVAGDQVRYVHGSDLTEVYDVRSDGIEQSFVFATKPVGTGDLVVRGRITTELPLAFASDDGVGYELLGTGGVTFGAVTGVDANGAKARGSIRTAADGSHVEWVLPAAFVDGAAYPLVLDPLIGSVIAIGNGAAGADTRPSVAYNEATNRYLVVWNVATSATTAQVRGQLVSSAGSVLGSSLLLEPQSLLSSRPAVANLRQTGEFVVGFIRNATGPLQLVDGHDAFVRKVDPGTGAMGPVVNVQPSGSSLGDPVEIVMGGESRHGFGGSANVLLVVLRRDGIPAAPDNRISAHLIDSFVTGLGGVASQVLATSGNPLGDIAVTAHAGDDLSTRWLVVWLQGGSTGPSYTSMVGQFVRPSTTPLCGLPFPLRLGSTVLGNPSVATLDGVQFAAAWEENGDILVLPFTRTGSCAAGTLTIGTAVSPLSSAINSEPALVHAKDKFVLAWRRSTSLFGATDVYAKGLDPVTCATCGVEWAVDSSTVAQMHPAIAAKRSGSDLASDEALVVWSNGTIRGRRFEARSNDVVTSMGGACSQSGLNDYATYNGDAVLGATDFELVLANPVSLPLILVLGFGNFSAPCGSCTLVPTPDILLPAVNPYPLAMPCDPLLVGVDLYTQWVLLKPSDCPILPDLAFSNALRFTIGE